jgi:hypothetical protein
VNEVYTFATLVTRNAGEAIAASVVGCGGSLESGGQLCVAAFDRNMATVVLKKFSLLI